MARRKLFGGESAPPQPESYRMPLAFVDGPRHPAPVRRDLAALAASSHSLLMQQEAPSVELIAAAHTPILAAAERPLDVQGIVTGRDTPSTRTALHGLSSRLGAVT
jgi:hypothetical protein